MRIRMMFLIIAFSALTSLDLKAWEKQDANHIQGDSLSNTGKAEKQAVLTPFHWNVIKFNPTPMLLWGDGKNITLSYERLIKKNQSIAIQLGYLVLPKFLSDTLLQVVNLSSHSRHGVNIAFDYRYYPGLRNRRPAPDGLYLGGYLSYYGFKFTNKLDILNTSTDQSGSMNGRLNMINLGIEIGYQFIFWKRFSLDMLLFGPSLSYFSRNLKFTGNLDQDMIDNIDQELADQLLNRFPVLGYLFGGQTATFSRSNFHFGTGFRYCIQLGFHF